MNRNLWLMVAAQGLFLTNNIVLVAINGLVGLSLAPYSWMATLPVMGYVVGGALSTGPVAWSQSRWGRKVSFQIGLAVAFFSALLGMYAVISADFWLLVTATVVAGYYSANGQLYRFAAAELAKPEYREQAVSMVLAGGIVGGVIGPSLARWTQHLGDAPFAGAYGTLAVPRWYRWPWCRWSGFRRFRQRIRKPAADARLGSSCASRCSLSARRQRRSALAS